MTTSQQSQPSAPQAESDARPKPPPPYPSAPGEPDRDVLIRLMEPQATQDPYPIYAWLREHAPAYYSQFGTYVLSRHADVEFVLKHADLFPGVRPEAMAQMFPQAAEHEAYQVLVTSLVGSNPPKHTRLRRLIGNGFTARRMADLTTGLERWADVVLAEAADRLRAGETIDLHSAVSAPMPMHMISDLIGIPTADRRRLAERVPDMMNVVDPAAGPEAVQRADDAFAELGEYLEDLIRLRRADPADDLISAMISTRNDEPDQLDDDELRTLFFTLWAAGFETTATAIDNAVILLLADGSRAKWLQTPEGTSAFVAETLRYEPSVQVAPGIRFAAETVQLGEETIVGGSQVRLLIGAANRDRDAFTDADSFDPARTGGAKPLSFGAGIHYCLGAGLAQVEMAVILPKLHAAFPGLALAGPPERRRSIPLRDFVRLPVTLETPPGRT